MRFICHGRTEPELNLALEEILLTTNHDDVFMLWQNSPSVIIGRNQNAHCEVDREYIQNHDIKVIRRISGGGTVYHEYLPSHPHARSQESKIFGRVFLPLNASGRIFRL